MGIGGQRRLWGLPDSRADSRADSLCRGREGLTALLLGDAEPRVAPVQDGALGADAALAQHLALLWVQRAQHPILACLSGLTG